MPWPAIRTFPPNPWDRLWAGGGLGKRILAILGVSDRFRFVRSTSSRSSPHPTSSHGTTPPRTMLARTLRLTRPVRLPRLATTPFRTVHQSKPTPPSERPSLATDPYPLPLSQPQLADDPSAAPRRTGQTSLDSLDEELSLPQPLDRTGEDVDTLRARLVYQTRKRGTLETDLILSTFAKEYLPTMSEDEMKLFDKVRSGVPTRKEHER